MKNFYVLAEALDYIENNLLDELTQERIAKNCNMSVSRLQKVFRYTFNYSVKEYITKRRLTHAAEDLINTQDSITNIAMKYQYNSLETFIRAFRKLWGKTPSEFRANDSFANIFPRMKVGIEESTGELDIYQEVSELYDKILESKDTYVICFDIMGLIPINQISRDAGDLAIMEAVRRIMKYKDESMSLFRIGGDEFALLTGYTEVDAVEAMVGKVLSHNHDIILFKKHEISVQIRVWYGKYLEYTDSTQMTKQLLNNVRTIKRDFV